MKFAKLNCITAIALFALLSSLAWASTTWSVNGVNGSDTNDCKSPANACKTIGHAISLASSGDSIMVGAATYTENLTLGISLTIVGSGAAKTIVDGGGLSTVFTISNSANVSLSRLTMRNGLAAKGGGLQNNGALTINNGIISANTANNSGGGIYNSGTLTINRSTIKGNNAFSQCPSGCTIHGGGIFNDSGTLTINTSTISGNSVSASCGRQFCHGDGGGIFNNTGTVTIANSTISDNVANESGGIENSGTLMINNSTLSGNSASFNRGNAFGGGIENGGTLQINNSTIAGNSALGSAGSYGGGIYGSATLQNSIVANSTSGGNCYGTMTSNGYNLSSDRTCKLNNVGDLNGTDPMLGPLQNNGGPTLTMALPSGSPAIDAGSPSGCTDSHGHLLKTDQRGMPRPDKEDTGGCDMGAYESQSD